SRARSDTVQTEHDLARLETELAGSSWLMPRYLRAFPAASTEVYAPTLWFETVMAITRRVPFAVVDLTHLLITEDGGHHDDGRPGTRVNLWLETRLLYMCSVHVFYTCRQDQIASVRKKMPEHEIFAWRYDSATEAVTFDPRTLRQCFYRFLRVWEARPFP